MNALYLKVLETNEKAYSLYKKLGYKENGRIPQQIFRNGSYHDYIHMSLLRDEWKEIKNLGGV
jgi:RimJ/RimL family protein N-acetyltransferase